MLGVVRDRERVDEAIANNYKSRIYYKSNGWYFPVRLQPIYRESISARSTECQDQRGKHETIPKAKEGRGE